MPPASHAPTCGAINLIPFAGTIRAVLYTALVVVPPSYIKGCSDERSRFEDFKQGVEVLGQAHEQIAKATALRHQNVAQGVQDENSRALRSLADLYGGLLNAPPRRSPVPPAPATAAGVEAKVCYSQDDLSRGLAEALRSLRTGTYGILRQGDEALIDRASWGEWDARVRGSDTP